MSYTPPIGSATTTSRGVVQLAGDIGGTATAVSVLKVNGVAVSGAPTNNQVLTATSATTANWATPASSPVATTTTTGTITLAGDLAGTGAAPSVARVNGVSVSGTPTTGQVLTASSASAASWTTPAAGFADPLTTKGDIIVRGAATTRQPVGTNGQVLIADSAQTTGIRWGAVDDASAVKLAGSTMTGKLVVPTFQVTGGTLAVRQTLVSDASGNATWQIAPGTTPNVVTKTSAYTAQVGDYILLNMTTAAITITTPAPTAGGAFSVKKIDTSGNNVTVTPSSGNIDGYLVSWSFDTGQLGRGISQDFISDGTNWYLT